MNSYGTNVCRPGTSLQLVNNNHYIRNLSGIGGPAPAPEQPPSQPPASLPPWRAPGYLSPEEFGTQLATWSGFTVATQPLLTSH